MTQLEIKLKDFPIEIPEPHRREAERGAKEAFVLALLKQGDINPVQASELLSINSEQLLKLATERNIVTLEESPILGLSVEERNYISRQARLFRQMRLSLSNEYLGQWVFFEDGKVLDADRDRNALTSRVTLAMSDRVVLIKKVEPENTRLGADALD